MYVVFVKVVKLVSVVEVSVIMVINFMVMFLSGYCIQGKYWVGVVEFFDDFVWVDVVCLV